MELVDERRFTIVDSTDMSTLAFLITEPESGSDSATIKKLDYVLEDKTNRYKKTFFVSNTDMNTDFQDYEILLLSIGKDKAFMNMATLKKDEILISKEPAKVSYKTFKTENSVSYQDVKYTPNFRRPISIVDPEIADEVRPVLYFDEEANMVKARVKLLPDKSYIALEVQKKDNGDYQSNYTVCTFE